MWMLFVFSGLAFMQIVDSLRMRPYPLGKSLTRLFGASSVSSANSKLPRLWFQDSRLSIGKLVTLQDDSSHYLTDVLRKKVGSEVRLFNSDDGEYLCTIESANKIGKRSSAPMTVSVNEMLREPITAATSATSVSLYFSPIKRTRMKTLFEKASELGVDHFYPIQTSNTQATINEGAARRQVIEHAEQSERLCIPSLHRVVSLDAILAHWQKEKEKENEKERHRIFVCRERSCGQAKPLLTAAREALSPPPSTSATGSTTSTSICIFVGPEGGFTEAEIKKMESLDFIEFVSLGDTVLRSETAAIVAVGLVVNLIEDVQHSHSSKFEPK